jgi:hypothetical protein
MHRAILAFLGAALLTGPAAAIDLTGTWVAEKGLKCRIRSNANAGFKESDGNIATLAITQVGDEMFVLVNEGDAGYEQKFRGPSLTHPGNPEKGYAVATACTVDGKYYAGTLLVRKSAADAEKGKLSVVYYGTRFSGTVAECKGTYERTSDVDPAVTATCP